MASYRKSTSSDFILRHRRSRPIQRRTSMGGNDAAIPHDVNISSVESGEAKLRGFDSRSSHTADTEVHFTSLRSLIASSPPLAPMVNLSDIQIGHPLLRRVAHAYLRLTPTCEETKPRRQTPLQRLLARVSAVFRPFRGCFEFVGRCFNCTLGSDEL